jgi:hypothetical protein
MPHATGEFTVKLIPKTPPPGGAEANTDTNKSARAIPLFAQMTNDKEWSGDLVATSQGEMISAGTAVSNSAAYVSLERVEGVLAGRKGSFVLAHYGIMDRGKGTLTVVIVPDSGTDELADITGTLTIRVDAAGKHFYDLEYEVSS